MVRDARPQREEKLQRPDRPAKSDGFLTEFEEPPRWDWQAWVWLVFWTVALGSLLFGVVGGLLLEKGTNPVWILIGLVLSTAGSVLWARWRVGRKRTAAIAHFARENGHAFKLAVKGKELEALPPFPLFRLGEKRRARNVIGGTIEGLPFAFMDYTYEASLKPVVQLAQLAGIALPDESTFPVTQAVVAFPKLPRKLPACAC